jgi:uracil-DNA glycosylase family 4
MGLSTIMDHLDDANSDLCFRSLSNLNNQKVTPAELARECRKRGWHCMLAHDRVYITKTKAALNRFNSQHEARSYTELPGPHNGLASREPSKRSLPVPTPTSQEFPRSPATNEAGIPDLRSLFGEIHTCRACPDVVPSVASRAVVASWARDLVLMAQAPSEHGVRVSGVHWLDARGNLRSPGGTYLDPYLRRVGLSIDPHETTLPRPYTTNVLHCWPGHGTRRDRPPKPEELKNCQRWWKTELRLLRPKAVLLLGGPAAEAFARACNLIPDFPTMLEEQGALAAFESVAIHYFTVPHPTAPYRGPRGGRNEYYDLAFCALATHLGEGT